MRDSAMVLNDYFLEMRWRCLSLAADLDRVQRADRSHRLPDDPRLIKLRQAIGVLTSNDPNRAEQVQMIFSDMTPSPSR